MNWRTEFAEEILLTEELVQDAVNHRATVQRKLREIDAAYQIRELLDEGIAYKYDTATGKVEIVFDENKELSDPSYDYYGQGERNDSIDLHAEYTDPATKILQTEQIFQLHEISQQA